MDGTRNIVSDFVVKKRKYIMKYPKFQVNDENK